MRRASHATDWVDYQGVPDQFKEVVIAGAVAIGVGTGQIETHFPSVGEDQLTLAMAIGQRGNERTGIDGIQLLRLRGEAGAAGFRLFRRLDSPPALWPWQT